MVKFLYANGCSHTAGSEIEGSGINSSQYNIERSYPAIIANKLKCKYFNDSYPGGSNIRIYRKTLSFLSNWLIEQKLDIKMRMYQ